MRSKHLRVPRRQLVQEARTGILASAGAPTWPEHSLEIIKSGLPKTSRSQRILVIGAGMAGLVAANLLKAAGHEIVILEASARVGGRVRTLREPFVAGQYGEAGAMRIPTTHSLVNAYIQKFNLCTNPFVQECARAYVHVNGGKLRVEDYRRNPDALGYPTNSREKGKDADTLLGEAIEPIIRFIREDPGKSWKIVVDKYDKYSVRTFLSSYVHDDGSRYSEGAIEMIGVLLDEESLMMTSFIESIRDQSDISPKNEYLEIVGGNDLLPSAFLPDLQPNLVFRARLRKISREGDRVKVYYENPTTLESDHVDGDLAICTLPFSALRHVEVEVEPRFSHEKRKAIRQLHYDTSTKILLQFRRRFWEKEGIFGGGTTTDLPIRFVYYPSHNIGSNGPGVLLASYTWADDSLRWDSLSERERLRYSLNNLAKIHGNVVYDEFITGATHSWVQDEYTCGAFALFAPEQQTTLWPALWPSEDRVIFAGEHTTLQHAWIEGAIESGIRAASEVEEHGSAVPKSVRPTFRPADKRNRPSPETSHSLAVETARTSIPEDPTIRNAVNSVSEDALRQNLTELTALHTRHTESPHNLEATEWLVQRAAALGHLGAPLKHAFQYHGCRRYNVICGKDDQDTSKGMILFCAHFDSRNEKPDDAEGRAPGADDNGSGVVALLELARVLGVFTTHKTIQFAFFSGEEQGLIGSTAYAADLALQNTAIDLVVNLDMIGHRPAEQEWSVVVEQDMGNHQAANDRPSQEAAQRMIAVAQHYTRLRPTLGPIYSSDYMPFEHYGYPCIGLFDGADHEPFYHTSHDTIEQVDSSYHAEVVKLLTAFALHEARIVLRA